MEALAEVANVPVPPNRCQTCGKQVRLDWRYCRQCAKAYRAAKAEAKVPKTKKVEVEYSRPLQRPSMAAVFQAANQQRVRSCECGLRYVGVSCPRCARDTAHR